MCQFQTLQLLKNVKTLALECQSFCFFSTVYIEASIDGLQPNKQHLSLEIQDYSYSSYDGIKTERDLLFTYFPDTWPLEIKPSVI